MPFGFGKVLEPVQELLEKSLSCIVLPLCSPVSVRLLLMERCAGGSVRAEPKWSPPRGSSFPVMDEFGWKPSVEL